MNRPLAPLVEVGTILVLLSILSSCDGAGRSSTSSPSEGPVTSTSQLAIDERWSCTRDPFKLFEAATADDAETVRSLARECVPTAEASVQDDIALQRAARAGASHSVRVLLKFGADLDYRDAQDYNVMAMLAVPAFHSVTRQEDINKVRLANVLVRAGAEVDRPTINGATPLELAGGSGFHRLVAALLRLGAAVDHQNDQGLTALMAAATANNRRAAEILISAGADATLRDDRGRTASDHAKQWASRDFFRYLSDLQ